METILFSATWCYPCSNLKEHTKNRNISFDHVYDIDTDEGKKLAIKHGVRGVPTLILVDNGVEKDRMVGFKLDKLNDFFREV